ncbi:hypothetical protein [Methylobacterium sp. R2-1]|uniref:hypothetical protein n=1 Tax=Methylobacterium sp. R2-1 TaxID=2587064 RepID=UPI00161BA44D|nr:hypothetical protein [Methylobacterium sp. R2-1]MBB2964326.1 hypothetical protein [Methylobacterium sp. R2-1]
MSIRTDDEYRAALARLDNERVILRSRSLTDDEQHNFDALMRDIEAYQATHSPGATSAPMPRTTEAPAPQSASTQPSPQPFQAASGQVLASASMRRELERRGMTAVAQPDAGASASQASMDREIRRQGLTPRGPA